MADTECLISKPTGNGKRDSGYESIPKGDRNTDQSEPQQLEAGRRCGYKRCLKLLACTIIFLALIAIAITGIRCTVYFHHKDAACYKAVPQISIHTRSGAYSDLFSTLDLSCSERPIGVEALLDNEAASVEIVQSLCEAVEKRYFQTRYNRSDVHMRVNQPASVFSEDFSPHINYFLNGSIQIGMVGITTGSVAVPGVGVAIELCLFMNNDDFKTFRTASTNWKNFIRNAKCHTVQVKTGDSNSTIFHISEPTFAFVGIATTGNVSIGIITVNANGFEVSGMGENATKICQLNGKHPTCRFQVINDEKEEFCLVAHEEERSDGNYYYSNLTIKFTTKTNVRFWVCLSVLLAYIVALALLLIIWCYKKWKKARSTVPVQETKAGPVSTFEGNIQEYTDDLPTSTKAIETPPRLEDPTTKEHSAPVLDEKTSAEVERTVHAQAKSDVDGQLATTAPNRNATEPRTQKGQWQSINTDQDPDSSEAPSRKIFNGPTSAQQEDHKVVFAM